MRIPQKPLAFRAEHAILCSVYSGILCAHCAHDIKVFVCRVSGKRREYGNKGIQINARYKDINDVQLLGSVYEHNKDKDVVIYHKEYSVNVS